MATLYDPSQGLRRLPYFALGGSVESSEFNKDDTCLVIGTVEGTATVWDVPSGRRRFAPLPHTRPVSQVTFLGDGSRILTVAQYHSETHFFKEQRDELERLLPQHRGAHLRVWDARTGEALTPTMTMPLWVFSTDLSPDGTLLAAAGGADDYESGILCLWDVKTGQAVLSHKLPRPAGYVSFSPDGRFLATAEAMHEGTGAAFRVDAVTIWDVATGKQKWQLAHEASVTGACFHPTHPDRLLTASRDHTVHLWNLETGQPLGPPFLHPAAVQDVAYTEDGRFVASATEHGDVRLWDPATGEPVTPSWPRSYDEYSSHSLGGSGTSSSALHGVDRAWPISPALHKLDDLVDLSNLMTWRTASGGPGLARRDAASFRATWQRLRAAYAKDFQGSAEAVLNWHQREALRFTAWRPNAPRRTDPSELYAAVWHMDHLVPLLAKPARNWLILRGASKREMGQVEAALADYATALELAPRDENLLETRAGLLIGTDELAKAREDLQRALAILYAEHQQAKAQQGAGFRYYAADVLYISSVQKDLPLLCLGQDDREGYRRACEQLVELSCQDIERSFLGAIAWSCVLAPQGFVDPDRIVAIAEAASAAGDGAALRTHGAALYRAGKLEQAAKRLREALAVQAEFPSAWLFLAMAEHRQDRAEEAKKWLDKAAAWIEREEREKKKIWGERVYLRVLLREARQVLGTSASAR
jgi:tetratricopeptide (TPR) repeat protein